MEEKQSVQMAKGAFLFLILLFLLPCFNVLAYSPTQKIPLAVQMDYNNGTGPIKGCRLNFSVWYENGTLINEKYYGREIGAGLYENKTFQANISGDYMAVANCTKATNVFYTRGFSFSLGEDDNMIIPILILAPLILGIIIIIWQHSLGEEHQIFKIFLQLAAFLSFLATANLGAVALMKFYNFPEFVDSLAFIVTAIGWLAAIVICYFLFYFIWYVLNLFKQKKKAKQEGGMDAG